MNKKESFVYEIHYTKAAEKFFEKNEDIRAEYESAIREFFIGENPESIDIKRIKGKRGTYYRIRLGKTRIVFAIVNGVIVVVKTILAGPRGDVYKKFTGSSDSFKIYCHGENSVVK